MGPAPPAGRDRVLRGVRGVGRLAALEDLPASGRRRRTARGRPRSAVGSATARSEPAERASATYWRSASRERSNGAIRTFAAIFEAFPVPYLSGADPNVLVFLDVEKHSPMAADYDETWSATIISEAPRISNQRVGVPSGSLWKPRGRCYWAALKRAHCSRGLRYRFGGAIGRTRKP
jgi:hypothetical protein